MSVTGMTPEALRIEARVDAGADWDSFVTGQPGASVYLLSGFSLIIRDVFGHTPRFLEARDAAGALVGVLPVIQQRTLLGNFATSMPFFNYGGALSPNPQVRAFLMDRARQLADELGCSYLELRDVDPQPGAWDISTDKVSMILPLPRDFGELAKKLGSKLRSQVKRAERESPATRTGGVELLDDFYDVFARNMRDLGTPVYTRRFFAELLARFPSVCRLLVVYRGKQPAAAAFLVIHDGAAEIPWAACRADAKPLGFNMKLYWEVLSFVVGLQCTRFDFGRSSADSGTYRFKSQWGALPLQLHWHRWHREAAGKGNGAREPGRLMRTASALWRHLPVPVANTIGPLVSPGLPW